MKRSVRMVVADIDGTLLNTRKQLTPAVREAIDDLQNAGIMLVLCTGRAGQGMDPLVTELEIRAPVAALNGGVLLNPDFSIARAIGLGSDSAQQAIDIITRHGIDIWAFTDSGWFVQNSQTVRVDHEIRVVKFHPQQVRQFDALHAEIVKLVAVCDDLERLSACETELRTSLGEVVSVARTQPYYLDVTHTEANKGRLVRELREKFALQKSEIVSIGDMPADADMFAESGLGIAMGNALEDVKRLAHVVTASCDEDGFAIAMRKFVL